MKIIDLRNTQSRGWVIDLHLNDEAILPVSIPMKEIDDESNFFFLMDCVNQDERHINVGDPRTPSEKEMDILSKEWKETYSSLMEES